MNFSFILKNEAVKEFVDAYVWYEEQKEGLGDIFETKLFAKLNRICNNPRQYNVRYKKFHQAVLDTFPFVIFYTVDEVNKQIVVFAIFHTSRSPKKKFKR